MEKSVKPYSGRERVIPAALMIVGLVCASWITISTTGSDGLKDADPKDQSITQDQDTTKKTKRATYSKSKVTTYDKKGTPKEEITEHVEGDEDLREQIAIEHEDFAFHFVMPPMPPMEMEPPMPAFTFHYDTLPPMHWKNDADMEKFTEEFQKKFETQFADFYKKHEEEIEKMMEEVQKELQSNGMDEEWQKEVEARMKEHEVAVQKHMATVNLEVHQKAMKEAEVQMHQMKKIHMEHAVEMEKHAQELEKHSLKMEKHAKAMEEKTRQFEKEVQEQLIKDGYLKKDEKIQNMNWSSDGKITINGKEVKDTDRKKYDAIHDKYFNSKGSLIFVE